VTPYAADLHVHSRHSRATARNMTLPELARHAALKGIAVVGTGDFTHPAWREEIGAQLVERGDGLLALAPDVARGLDVPASCPDDPAFLLTAEISTIYKRDGRTRKVHHVICVPGPQDADRVSARLAAIGNIRSDGRPILGLDSRDLLEIVLESSERGFLFPAHVWTPWFSVLGSRSGFDSVDDCYADLARYVFAAETGLSSDPPMNWRVPCLDRFRLVSFSDAHSPHVLGREATLFDGEPSFEGIRRALETGDGWGGTIELFPEEGKYHLDGHRKCGVRLEPESSRDVGDTCPVCGRPLTLGVLHRVELLAGPPDRPRPPTAGPFTRLVPLAEVLSEVAGRGPRTKTVGRLLDRLVDRLGPELHVLREAPIEDIARAEVPRLDEAIARLRAGTVEAEAGYDGEYGTVRVLARR